MKKFISKITFILMIAFVIGIGYGGSAKASTDVVTGINNLNGTTNNSAKVGDQLNNPEKGWKRYSCFDDKLNYEGSWDRYSNTYYTYKYTPNGNGKIKFKISGNKIRIIGVMWNNTSKDIEVSIDNNFVEKIDTSKRNDYYSSLVFERTNLGDGDHYIEIAINDSKYFDFVGIDVDENGNLNPYKEQQSITLNKNLINLLEGKSEKLIATVTPNNIKDKKIIWSSSDESIAKVDENGDVRALKEGEVVITAVVEGTDLKAECKVTVTKKDVPVEPSKPDTKPESKGDAVLFITMTNGNIKSYTVSMKTVNKFIEWYEDRASGSNGNPFFKFDKTKNEDEIKTEYIVFDKISSFQIEQNK